MRGAIDGQHDDTAGNRFQLTLPMRGAILTGMHISIKRLFQLTLPMRGAITKKQQALALGLISTHAPHAGSDVIAPLRII